MVVWVCDQRGGRGGLGRVCEQRGGRGVVGRGIRGDSVSWHGWLIVGVEKEGW